MLPGADRIDHPTPALPPLSADESGCRNHEICTVGSLQVVPVFDVFRPLTWPER